MLQGEVQCFKLRITKTEDIIQSMKNNGREKMTKEVKFYSKLAF